MASLIVDTLQNLIHEAIVLAIVIYGYLRLYTQMLVWVEHRRQKRMRDRWFMSIMTGIVEGDYWRQKLPRTYRLTRHYNRDVLAI